MKHKSLSRRIAVAFLGLALFAGGLGGLITLVFVYNTEDLIFNRLLTLEAEHFHLAASAESLPEAKLPFATYYHDDELPEFLMEPLEAEPGRSEVFGLDGQHYHLRRVEHDGLAEPVWIVLQVEDYLVVRPVLNEIMLVLMLSILATIAVAAVLGLFLARRVTRPLRSLANEVIAVEPDHLPDDWRTRYPTDEVGQLADTLRQAFRRINDFIDREQRFTQDASHELRTPVAVIESSAEMLAKSPDTDQATALVERIRSAALSMHLSVDALLALAREDDRVVRNQRTAMLPIVERAVVNHASLLEDKPVGLSVEVSPDWRIAGDPAALQVLVANLISNAFRYTERGQIRIERDGADLVISDTGVGIDDALKAKITEPAVKGETSTGMGLGLSIVERLCQRCGWRFELHSSPDGTTARLGLD